jgi:hypothetical protein
MAEERWELTNEQWKKPNHYYQNASAGSRFDNNTDFAFFERFSFGQRDYTKIISISLFLPKNVDNSPLYSYVRKFVFKSKMLA